MKNKIAIIIIATSICASLNSSEVNLPSWKETVTDIENFRDFYWSKLKTLKASLIVSNGTKKALMVAGSLIEQGQQSNIPVTLTPEIGMTVGAVYQITNASQEYLGTLGINVRSRGYYIAKYPKEYQNPKIVPDTVSVSLIVGKQSVIFNEKKFDIYALQNGLIAIKVNLSGENLTGSSVGIDTE